MKDSTKGMLMLVTMWVSGYATASIYERIEAQAYKRGFNSALNITGAVVKAIAKDSDEETEEKEEE